MAGEIKGAAVQTGELRFEPLADVDKSIEQGVLVLEEQVNPPNVRRENALQRGWAAFKRLIEPATTGIRNLIDGIKSYFAEKRAAREAESVSNEIDAQLRSDTYEPSSINSTAKFYADKEGNVDSTILQKFKVGPDRKSGPDKVIANTKSMIEDLKTREGVTAENLQEKIKAAVRDVVKGGTAFDLAKLDATHLRFIAKQSKDPNVSLALTQLASDVEASKRPEDAKAMFEKLGTDAMSQPPGTFLRGTGDAGAAAVRKIASSLGIDKDSSSIASVVKTLKATTGVKELDASLKTARDLKETDMISGKPMKGEIKTSKSPGLLPAEAESLKELSIDYLSKLKEKMAPNKEVKAYLTELSQEIMKRDDLTPKEKNQLVFRLYADQVFLKIVSPITGREAKDTSAKVDVAVRSPALLIAGDFVQQAANVVDGTHKLKDPGMLKAYQEAAPEMSKQINDILVNKFGMPTAAQQSVKIN